MGQELLIVDDSATARRLVAGRMPIPRVEAGRLENAIVTDGPALRRGIQVSDGLSSG